MLWGVPPPQLPTHLLEEQRRYTHEISTWPLPCRMHPPCDILIVQFLESPPTAARVHSKPGPGPRLQKNLMLSGHFCVGGGITMSGRSGFILWGLPTHGLHFPNQLRVRLLIFQELFVVEQQVSVWAKEKHSCVRRHKRAGNTATP